MNPPAGVDLDILDTCEAASMAKWRYETIVHTMSVLAKYRVICQGHIHPEWFQNAQDKTELQKVFTTCQDDFGKS